MREIHPYRAAQTSDEHRSTSNNNDLDEVDPGGADATYEGPPNKYAASVVRWIGQRVMSVAHPLPRAERLGTSGSSAGGASEDAAMGFEGDPMLDEHAHRQSRAKESERFNYRHSWRQ